MANVTEHSVDHPIYVTAPLLLPLVIPFIRFGECLSTRIGINLLFGFGMAYRRNTGPECPGQPYWHIPGARFLQWPNV